MTESPASPFPWWYPRQSHEAWSRVRAQGAARFILLHGVAWYGGVMFLVLGLLLPLLRDGGGGLTADSIALGALVWACAGFAWGLLVWLFTEHNFRKHSSSNGTLQP